MQKEFVEYELALRLKALGFDEPCLAIHSNANPKTGLYTLNKYRLKLIKQGSQKDKGVKAPTFSQCFRWFREKYGLYSWIQLHNGYIDDSFYKKLPITWTVMGHESGKQYYERDIDHNYLYNTHEEAEVACLTKLIEIVEFKKE